MNKKLLCSTALAGALIVSGSALAELKIGGNFTHTANFGSDSGNNLSSTIALPAVGQHIGTLGQLVSQTNPLNWDSLMEGGEANNESHVSLNAKAAGGTFSVIYTPNTAEVGGDNDAATINASAGGSAMAVLYTGNPVPNVGFWLHSKSPVSALYKSKEMQDGAWQ